ncbi:hypothetical protein MXF49_10195 [Klebsiella pneumoniae]|uniref:capsid assembly protein n=1 Tax=Klebsiella pneumoniae TaxID=573 RepID=UPI002DBD1C8D|nr:hypothetical protein [Klebsiella pneumoniae]MEB6166067.1 hypothetical protein [Klebsiella pneumoniae]
MSQSNSDVYAEFGATSESIISDGSLSEHDLAMLEMDVSVRDGDDSIELGEDIDFDEIEEEEEEEEETEEEVEEINEVETPKTSNEISELVDSNSREIQEGRDGLESMIESAVANGMPQEAVNSIIGEYLEDSQLSEKSLATLEQYGFNRKFVANYIAGQQAMVDRMANSLVEYVGGVDKWNTIISHLETNDSDTLDALQDALDNNNIKVVKSILSLTNKTITTSKSQKFGNKAQRSVTKSARPQIQTRVDTVKGYATSQEMVEAMSDKRYSRDPKYRAEVEQRVMRSNF